MIRIARGKYFYEPESVSDYDPRRDYLETADDLWLYSCPQHGVITEMLGKAAALEAQKLHAEICGVAGQGFLIPTSDC